MYARALYADESGDLAGVSVSLASPSFEFVIRRDGEEISRTSQKPRYETWYPNGKECAGESGGCLSGSAIVEL